VAGLSFLPSIVVDPAHSFPDMAPPQRTVGNSWRPVAELKNKITFATFFKRVSRWLVAVFSKAKGRPPLDSLSASLALSAASGRDFRLGDFGREGLPDLHKPLENDGRHAELSKEKHDPRRPGPDERHRLLAVSLVRTSSPSTKGERGESRVQSERHNAPTQIDCRRLRHGRCTREARKRSLPPATLISCSFACLTLSTSHGGVLGDQAALERSHLLQDSSGLV
jgi:hypothetical protein